MKKTEKKAKTNAPRQPYIKPQMEKVQLVPEEAVLKSCKAFGGGNTGPDGVHCLPPSSGQAACLELSS